MPHRDAFSNCHPAVSFAGFTLILIFSVCLMHPLCLLLSFFSGFVYCRLLRRGRAAGFSLWLLLPIMGLTALVNPAFSHKGVTVLGYLPTGNPMTLESILYGIAAAILLGAVLLWGFCWTEVLTADKLLCLFGKIAPSLSLLLSMTLRFVPLFSRQLQSVSDAQKGLGRMQTDSRRARLRAGGRTLSIVVTWSLEHAAETADAMKSRGYGLSGRSSFALYTFRRRDALALLWLFALGCYVLLGILYGAFSWYYYPAVSEWSLNAFSFSQFFAFGLLCFTPVLWYAWEVLQWRKYRSN